MAKQPAGLAVFGSPTLTAMDLEPLGNPYDPAPDIGVGNFVGDAMSDLKGTAQKARSQFAMPTKEIKTPKKPTGSTVLFSPSQNKMFVNGSLFDADDADTALKAADSINRGRRKLTAMHRHCQQAVIGAKYPQKCGVSTSMTSATQHWAGASVKTFPQVINSSDS